MATIYIEFAKHLALPSHMFNILVEVDAELNVFVLRPLTLHLVVKLTTRTLRAHPQSIMESH